MKINKLLQLLRDNATARAEGEPSIRVESADTEAHVYVYDVIDQFWGASATGLIEAMSGQGERTMHLHINSPGGDVFEARAMAAAVVAYPGAVSCHIDGLAASAATYVAMAGNDLSITEGGLLMVHESWTLAYGNKRELRSTSDLLDKIDSLIAADYARQTGAPLDQVVAWMEAETWFTPEEAKAAGFVDAITTNTKRAAQNRADAKRWNLSAYANAPKALPAAAMATNEPQLDALVSQQLQLNRNRLAVLQRI